MFCWHGVSRRWEEPRWAWRDLQSKGVIFPLEEASRRQMRLSTCQVQVIHLPVGLDRPLSRTKS